MTSRELVIKTLEFDKPSRIPRQLWLLPWATSYYPEKVSQIRDDFPDDIIHSPCFRKEVPAVSGDPYAQGTYIDEWGCAFENRQAGLIGEVKNPLVLTWEDMEKIHVPVENLTVDVDKINEFCQNHDEFVLGGCYPRIFERLQFIRGTENLMTDLAWQPEPLSVLINTVHQHYLEEFEVWAKTDVDGLTFMDDWGTQRSLLISPEMWRNIFKPLYRDYIELAHQHGKKVFMHSDGYIHDIYPDLIELGLDALNSQIFCMDIPDLGRNFKGKITFWGEIDRQYILPNGSQDEIIKAVQVVYEHLYQGGGVIAQCEFGTGAHPDNVYQVFKAWTEISPS